MIEDFDIFEDYREKADGYRAWPAEQDFSGRTRVIHRLTANYAKAAQSAGQNATG
jgi:hypothetical protein